MNINVSIKISVIIVTLLTANVVNARQSFRPKPQPTPKATRAGCTQTTAFIDLDINNVRARIRNGGDMWWDNTKGVAAYEVPKSNGGIPKNSLFAGAVWIGGYEIASEKH